MADAREERPRSEGPAKADSGGQAPAEEGQPPGGAESYGGDTDAGPSVTEEELERGLKRDQAEG